MTASKRYLTERGRTAHLTPRPRAAHLLPISVALAALFSAGCSERPKTAAEVLENVDEYIGQHVIMKAKFRPGIRCRLATEDGEWQTYCRDCQVCKGPYVVDQPSEDLDAWPMILGGTWDLKPIRCEGPLNDVKCQPFELGKMYVVEGVLERSTPPKLFVDRFRLAD